MDAQEPTSSGTWHSRNRTRLRDYQKEYRRQNPNKVKASEASRDKVNRRAKMKASEQRLRAVHPWRSIVREVQRRAKKKGKVCDLTNDWAKARWTGRCEVSGIEFKPGAMRSMLSASVDRIDPKAGYLQSNCRFVLMAVNMLKGWGTEEEMFMVAQAI